MLVGGVLVVNFEGRKTIHELAVRRVPSSFTSACSARVGVALPETTLTATPSRCARRSWAAMARSLSWAVDSRMAAPGAVLCTAARTVRATERREAEAVDVGSFRLV